MEIWTQFSTFTFALNSGLSSSFSSESPGIPIPQAGTSENKSEVESEDEGKKEKKDESIKRKPSLPFHFYLYRS